MSLASAFDFLRVLLAFALIFCGLPMLGDALKIWRNKASQTDCEGWMQILLRAFIRASLAAETAGLILGGLKLCLSGLIIGLCVIWCITAIWTAVRSAIPQTGSLQNQGRRQGDPRWTLMALFLCTLIICAVHVPLVQAHFDHAESYLRTVSLGILVQGQAWQPYGSVALLAPLVPISGLAPISVVRFTGPLFAVGFVLLIALSLWHIWRSLLPVLACFAVFICVSLSPDTSWELTSHGIAAVYWIAAGVAWRVFPATSRKDALLAALTALMIAPDYWIGLVASGLLIIGMSISLARRAIGLRTAVCFFATCLVISVALFWRHEQPPSQSLQYESAARTCEAIGREFPHNEWLVVSPFHELACVYGQGWHAEMSSFISQFELDQVSKPGFHFPYELPDVFFFVERRPLQGGPGSKQGAVWRYAPAQGESWHAYLYGDSLGRASLEYRAAELLNAYASSHKDLTRFFEDENLIVYHLARTPA
jgi:hypothetical protein